MISRVSGDRGSGIQSAHNLTKDRLELGLLSALDSSGRTIFVADAHCDGKRFVVRADEMLTAFLEPESAIIAPASGCLQRLVRRLCVCSLGNHLLVPVHGLSKLLLNLVEVS